jgi:predicted neuraminidase
VIIHYNDTTEGHHSLAISISEDEVRSWKYTRHLELEETGQYHYPAVIQGRDGRIHLVYSYFVQGGRSMKHAVLNDEWIRRAHEAN